MRTTIGVLVLLLCVFPSCSREPERHGPKFGTSLRAQGEPVYPVYGFAVHPLHNPAKLVRTYQPLIDLVNARLKGARLALEASRDYANFEEKYGARRPELLLPNPWQTLQAMKVGYHVVAMAGDPSDFRGIFVARRDSGLKRPVDLRGKRVSYPSPTALAACIMPKYFLHTHGVDVNSDIENLYVGSQESSIMNAYVGKTAAGATWPPPWRAFQRDHPREAAELEVLWETEPLINNSVMARDDVPARVVEQVQAVLLGLEATTEGKAILAGMETARFLPASDETYDVVRRYVARYEQEIGPVERQ